MSVPGKPIKETRMNTRQPGISHELLRKYVGNWDIHTKGWGKPGDEPIVSKASQKNELIFDGRYILSRFEGRMMGRKAEGLEVIGYDLVQNEYVTFWIDNMSTDFFTSHGTLDASGKVLAEVGTAPDPKTGEARKVKNVTTFLADGKYKFEMFMVAPDGKEFKSMEILATRKG